jgi:DNA invertase Pin-like site-specific DNA recombinase
LYPYPINYPLYTVATSERELIIERTQAGLEAARQRGRIGGRKRRLTTSKIESAEQLLANGIPPKEVANNLGVSIPTLYRWVPSAKGIESIPPQYP